MRFLPGCHDGAFVVSRFYWFRQETTVVSIGYHDGAFVMSRFLLVLA
jgi:hypothetical protein